MSTGSERDERLKQMLADASDAIAHLDAERLEEMALSCEALLAETRLAGNPSDRTEADNWIATCEMAIFRRVIDATRSNMNVMHRLRGMRMTQLEYSHGEVRSCSSSESGIGDD